ncbi:EamA family transporter [Desulfovibrio inopinatus]|uniref:EamA family transporter n=1 Tax=Desulfovibrio inopinatus TaxID=102109 RepID=UPI000556B103|nr:EamA family transporter [Desulfovibrio inopinatus]
MWFLFALCTALGQALKDVLMKHTVKSVDVLVVTWSYYAVASLFTGIVVLFHGIPSIGPGYMPSLAITSVVLSIAAILYTTALKSSDLSLSAPMLTTTPLFLLVTSPLIVGEFPDVTGLFGVVFIVVGSYVLNLGERKRGLLAPLTAIVRERGPRYMLIVALLWSISANIDKIGIRDSDPLFWLFSVFSGVCLILTPLVLLRSRDKLHVLLHRPLPFLAMGMLESTSIMAQMYALTLAIVPYVIAVKRMNAIFGVLFGALFFKEQGLRHRLPGAGLMVAGVALIALSG